MGWHCCPVGALARLGRRLPGWAGQSSVSVGKGNQDARLEMRLGMPGCLEQSGCPVARLRGVIRLPGCGE